MIWFLVPLVLLIGLAAGLALAWRFPLPNPYAVALVSERARVEHLMTLVMSREAPEQYAAYVEPQAPREEFPADAIWDDSGLYYAVPGDS